MDRRDLWPAALGLALPGEETRGSCYCVYVRGHTERKWLLPQCRCPGTWAWEDTGVVGTEAQGAHGPSDRCPPPALPPTSLSLSLSDLLSSVHSATSQQHHGPWRTHRPSPFHALPCAPWQEAGAAGPLSSPAPKATVPPFLQPSQPLAPARRPTPLSRDLPRAVCGIWVSTTGHQPRLPLSLQPSPLPPQPGRAPERPGWKRKAWGHV